MLVATLLASTTFGLWKIERLKKEKRDIDSKIANIEAQFQQNVLSENQTDQLANGLDRYEDEARALQTSLLYRFQVRHSGRQTQRGREHTISTGQAARGRCDAGAAGTGSQALMRQRETTAPHP